MCFRVNLLYLCVMLVTLSDCLYVYLYGLSSVNLYELSSFNLAFKYLLMLVLVFWFAAIIVSIAMAISVLESLCQLAYHHYYNGYICTMDDCNNFIQTRPRSSTNNYTDEYCMSCCVKNLSNERYKIRDGI